MPRILVSDALAEEGRRILEDDGANEVVYRPEITPEELVKEIAGFDALVIRSRTKVTEEVLRAAKGLKIVGRAGVGVDNVDIPVATECGIMVANAPEGNTMSTCEHAVSLMMSLARNIAEGDATMKAGKWDKKRLKGVELFGKTLGVVGLGKIGREVAKRMAAFGMTVWGADPYVSSEAAEKMGVALKSVDEIVAGADVVTIHTPKTKETTDLFRAETFQKMKKSAMLVNCARGGIVNEADLAAALEAGEIAGAALDVYTEEPLPEEHPLRKAPHLVLTPHLGASTAEAQEKVALQVAEQVVNACKGLEVTTALNAPAINAELLKVMQPHLELAEALGRFAVQLCKTRVTRLEISLSGSLLDYPSDPIAMSVMKGFLEQISDMPVNFVNARPAMKSKGVEVVENRVSEAIDFLNLLKVAVQTEDGKTQSVAGTVFARNQQRLVAVGDMHIEMRLEGKIILLENRDVPGIVGMVGTKLGDAGVNIAEISWGRDEQGGTAMTAILVDGPIPDAVVQKIGEEPEVLSTRVIEL